MFGDEPHGVDPRRWTTFKWDSGTFDWSWFDVNDPDPARSRPMCVAGLARVHDLFDRDDDVIAMCIEERLDLVLRNETCPEALRLIIRHPYDRASLELAIRAGDTHYEAARVHRMLDDLDDETFDDLWERLPMDLVRAWTQSGLAVARGADDFVNGRFAGLDLTDLDILDAVLGSPCNPAYPEAPEILIELLLRHPQAEELSTLLRRPDGFRIDSDSAWRLIDEGGPVVAAAGLPFVRPDALQAHHADACLAAGPRFASLCPGIAGRQRPERYPLGGVERLLPEQTADARPYVYPQPLAELDGAELPGADGWSIELPTSPLDLEANATRMQNCTSSWDRSIRDQRSFILIVHGPAGERVNAAVDRCGTQLSLGEVNTESNRRLVPAGLEKALAACLRRQRVPRPLREAEDVSPRTARRSGPSRRSR